MPGRGENGLKDKNRSISQLPAALQASLHSVGIPVRLFDSCSSPGLLTKSPIAVLCVQLWKAAVCLNKQQTQPFSTAEPLLKLLGWACPAVGTHSSTQPLVPRAAAAGLQVRGMLRELTPLLGVSCSFSLIYFFFFSTNRGANVQPTQLVEHRHVPQLLNIFTITLPSSPPSSEIISKLFL